jgi:putative phosphoribosyl transferase
VRFDDRREAGLRLGSSLSDLRARQPVVLAITAGGAVVAREIAQQLVAPLDVLIVERLRSPEDRAVTLGAAAEDGSSHLAERAASQVGISVGELRAMADDAVDRAARRGRVCRRGRPVSDLRDRLVIVTDDGAIHGCSLLAAVDAVQAHGPSEIHVAVPSVPRSVVAALRERVARVEALHVPVEPRPFAELYLEDVIPDDEAVADVLTQGGGGGILLAPGDDQTPPANDVLVTVGDGAVLGRLRLPRAATAAIVLAGAAVDTLDDGLAAPLSRHGCATLSLELPPNREPDRDADLDLAEIHRIAAQLVEAALWLRTHLALGALPVAFVGKGAVGAAVLRAAARGRDLHVAAIVSRSGRPDRVADDLGEVTAPTLLLVGERDEPGKASNTVADDRLVCEHALITVRDDDRAAGEPDPADTLARAWLNDHLHLSHRP